MLKRYCDKCGKETGGSWYHVQIEKRYSSLYACHTVFPPNREFELCEACAESLTNDMDHAESDSEDHESDSSKDIDDSTISPSRIAAKFGGIFGEGFAKDLKSENKVGVKFHVRLD